MRARLRPVRQKFGKIKVFKGPESPETVVSHGAVESVDNPYFRLLVVWLVRGAIFVRLREVR